MIIFHEGMPRAGKTLAATKDHLIPALARGRVCYVRIDGINYDLIAELAGITRDRCRELLFELTPEQCQNFVAQEFEKDSFIFIDEAQNYWPAKRGPAAPELLLWVAEHGHHGHDVLLMGQLAKDVHSCWINRTNRKVQFIKKDIIGKPDEYKWKMFNGIPDTKGNVRFVEVSRGDSSYEPRYFGAYKSHSDGTENKENYVDDRANLFKGRVFKRWIPIYIVTAVVALGVAIWAFRGGIANKEPEKVVAAAPVKAAVQPIKTVVNVPAPVAPVPLGVAQIIPASYSEKIPQGEYGLVAPGDYVDSLSNKYRIRLGGVMRGAKRSIAVIEWRDEQGGIKESLGGSDLSGFGWLLLISAEGNLAVLQKGNHRYVVSSWPLREVVGRTTELTQRNIRDADSSDRSGARTGESAGSVLPPTHTISSDSGTEKSGNDSTNPKYNVALRK